MPHPSLMQRFFRHQDGLAMLEFCLVFPLLLALVFTGVEFGRYQLIKQKFEKSAYMIGSIISQEIPAEYDADGNLIGITQNELVQNVFPNYIVGMAPFNVDTGATDQMGIIASSLHRDPATNQVLLRWQVGYTAPNSSANFDWQSSLSIAYVREGPKMRSLCTPACKPPAGLTTSAYPLSLTTEERDNINAMSPDEGMVVIELFYRYRPLYTQILKDLNQASNVAPGGWEGTEQLITHLYLMPRNGSLLYLPPHFPVPIH